MPSWGERWQKRQSELAEGADADLVHANRRRLRLALCLIGLAFAVTAIDAKVHLPKVVDLALRIVAVSCFVVGIVMGRWSREEREFLKRPDPEGPPEIFRGNS
jgi:hypothetical protein